MDGQVEMKRKDAYRIVQTNGHPSHSSAFRGRNGLDVRGGSLIGAYCEIPVKSSDANKSDEKLIPNESIQYLKWGGTKDGQDCQGYLVLRATDNHSGTRGD